MKIKMIVFAVTQLWGLLIMDMAYSADLQSELILSYASAYKALTSPKVQTWLDVTAISPEEFKTAKKLQLEKLASMDKKAQTKILKNVGVKSLNDISDDFFWHGTAQMYQQSGFFPDPQHLVWKGADLNRDGNCAVLYGYVKSPVPAGPPAIAYVFYKVGIHWYLAELMGYSEGVMVQTIGTGKGKIHPINWGADPTTRPENSLPQSWVQINAKLKLMIAEDDHGKKN